MKWLINKAFLTPSVEQLLSRQVNSWTSKTIVIADGVILGLISARAWYQYNDELKPVIKNGHLNKIVRFFFIFDHRRARSIFTIYGVFQNLLGSAESFFQFEPPFYLYHLKIALNLKGQKVWLAFLIMLKVFT